MYRRVCTFVLTKLPKKQKAKRKGNKKRCSEARYVNNFYYFCTEKEKTPFEEGCK